MTGVVAERLVPTVPIKIRKKASEWQEINLLLDTGFDGEIALDARLLNRYNLATQPDHQLLTPEMDCDFPRPLVEIRRVPRPTGSVRGFLDSLRNHFRS